MVTKILPRQFLELTLILVCFAIGYHKIRDHPQPAKYNPTVTVFDAKHSPVFSSRLVSKGSTRIVHAPSLVELGDGRLRAFWFAGSREGAKDVVIQSSVFDPKLKTWSQETTVVTRRRVQSNLNRYIKKVGNPVVIRESNGKLWLFFVTTSIGGWSTSNISLTTSIDDGLSWSSVRRLITSPFFNISTLVKTVPFFYRDGSLGLPVYHELFRKFGETVRVDGSGKVIGKHRLNARWRTLQPLMFIQSANQATGLMRYAGEEKPRRVVQVSTRDAGLIWSTPIRSVLPNPDSALAGIAISRNQWLVVINNNEVQRDDLTLLVSENGGSTWTEVYRFEDEQKLRGYSFSKGEFGAHIRRLFSKTDPLFAPGESRVSEVENVLCTGRPCGFQFGYPYLIRSTEGMFHLLYTWNQTYIKHVEFNDGWIAQTLMQRLSQ